MTLQDVAQAKQALEAAGVHPSYDAVRAKLGHGSKRDVTRFMQQLASSTTGGAADNRDNTRDILTSVAQPITRSTMGGEVAVPSPPLAAAQATARRTEIEEFEAQRQYQEARKRLTHCRTRVRDLTIQERMVRTIQEAAEVRVERRREEEAVSALEAELTALDEARKQANATMRETQATAADLETQASRAWRAYRAARQAMQDAAQPGALVDAAAADAAMAALAALIGTEEATACQDLSQVPAWVRGYAR